MKHLPFKANFKLEDVLTWEIATDLTIGEALANEAKKVMASIHGELVFLGLDDLEEAGRLESDIYVQEGDGYMLEGDPAETVYHDQYFIVVLSEKGAEDGEEKETN
jgi:hypothetical protein